MTITFPTPEAAASAYAQLGEEDRVAVDSLGEELVESLEKIRAAKGLKVATGIGPAGQHELLAKLYTFVAAKRKAETSSVPEAKAAPAIVEARDGVTVIQFKSVVNFYTPD